MAWPAAITNPDAQQTDGNILITWDAQTGVDGYRVQRSTDGAIWTTLTSSALISPQPSYVDTTPVIGTMYYYQVTGMSGSSPGSYSTLVQMVAAQPGEMSLYELRLRSQQCADRVQSDFVTNSEWNAFLRLALYELYDLQITVYEDYNIAPYAYINTNGTVAGYALPDGTNYKGGTLGGSSGTPLPSFYKLIGVDLGVNTSNNAWVTINRYDYIDRNAYVYPNSTSTIYGVYNMRYRVMGNNINFIPTPSGNQQVRLTYAPRLPGLLSDNDLTTIGYSGWLRYPIVRAAMYALDKEEGSDTSKLGAEIAFLKTRIEQSASNRDAGQAETISATRKDSVYGGNGWGGGGGQGGWAVFLIPSLISNNERYGSLANPIFHTNTSLAFVSCFVGLSYFSYLNRIKLCRWIRLFCVSINLCFASNICNLSTLRNHISHIFGMRAKE